MTGPIRIIITIAVLTIVGIILYKYLNKKLFNNNNNDNKTDDCTNGYKMSLFESVVGTSDRPEQWANERIIGFNFEGNRPPAKTFLVGDTIKLSNAGKYSGEYPVLGIWLDKSGNQGAIYTEGTVVVTESNTHKVAYFVRDSTYMNVGCITKI